MSPITMELILHYYNVKELYTRSHKTGNVPIDNIPVSIVVVEKQIIITHSVCL
jgi:hypothetical protein